MRIIREYLADLSVLERRRLGSVWCGMRKREKGEKMISENQIILSIFLSSSHSFPFFASLSDSSSLRPLLLPLSLPLCSSLSFSFFLICLIYVDGWGQIYKQSYYHSLVGGHLRRNFSFGPCANLSSWEDFNHSLQPFFEFDSISSRLSIDITAFSIIIT